MNIVPLLIMGALLLVLVVVSNRNKSKRTAADAERRRNMVPGTRVMTTSGMYGVVTAIDPANDGTQSDTVVLQIAPGVEVTWALAAVREAPERTSVAAADGTEPALATDTDPADRLALDTPDATTGAGDGQVRLVKPKGRTGER